MRKDIYIVKHCKDKIAFDYKQQKVNEVGEDYERIERWLTGYVDTSYGLKYQLICDANTCNACPSRQQYSLVSTDLNKDRKISYKIYTHKWVKG